MAANLLCEHFTLQKCQIFQTSPTIYKFIYLIFARRLNSSNRPIGPYTMYIDEKNMLLIFALIRIFIHYVYCMICKRYSTLSSENWKLLPLNAILYSKCRMPRLQWVCIYFYCEYKKEYETYWPSMEDTSGPVLKIDVNQGKTDSEKFYIDAIVKPVRIAIKLFDISRTIFYFDYCNGSRATTLHCDASIFYCGNKHKWYWQFLKIVNGISVCCRTIQKDKP